MFTALIYIFLIAWGLYGAWVILSMIVRYLAGERIGTGPGDNVHDG